MDAYPLNWPTGWPRTKYPQPARFKVTMGEAVSHLYDELDRLGASNTVLSSNMRVRLDGRPYADQKRMEDAGVALYFTLNGQQQCIPCDKWDSVLGNVRAIGLTIEALRGLDRWGAKEMVSAAFSGFKALPDTATPSNKRSWYDVLQVQVGAPWEVIEAAYKRMLHIVHPDKGGSAEAFQELQDAYKQAKIDRGIL